MGFVSLSVQIVRGELTHIPDGSLVPLHPSEFSPISHFGESLMELVLRSIESGPLHGVPVLGDLLHE